MTGRLIGSDMVFGAISLHKYKSYLLNGTFARNIQYFSHHRCHFQILFKAFAQVEISFQNRHRFLVYSVMYLKFKTTQFFPLYSSFHSSSYHSRFKSLSTYATVRDQITIGVDFIRRFFEFNNIRVVVRAWFEIMELVLKPTLIEKQNNIPKDNYCETYTARNLSWVKHCNNEHHEQLHFEVKPSSTPLYFIYIRKEETN